MSWNRPMGANMHDLVYGGRCNSGYRDIDKENREKDRRADERRYATWKEKERLFKCIEEECDTRINTISEQIKAGVEDTQKDVLEAERDSIRGALKKATVTDHFGNYLLLDLPDVVRNNPFLSARINLNDYDC